MTPISTSSYLHTQSVASSTWNVIHNLSGGVGTLATCDVSIWYNGVLEKIIPKSISIIDNNTIQILFTNPRTGIVVVTK